MESLLAYRLAIDPFWGHIESNLDSLPPNLYRLSRLLRQSLAVRYSTTGRLTDILRTPDADPVFHHHLWLLDDLDVARNDEREQLTEQVFGAAFYDFSQLHIRHHVRWGDLPIDHLALADWLNRQSVSAFARLFDGESPFWQDHHQSWESYDEVNLALSDANYRANQDELVEIHISRTAPLSLGPLAVAHWAQRPDRDHLQTMLDHLGVIRATRHDLMAIKRDLGRPWTSPTLRRMLAGAGIAPGHSVEITLGEILLDGAVEPVIEMCLDQAEKARRLAELLQLPTFTAHCRRLTEIVEETGSILSMKSARPAGGAVRFEAALPTVEEAVAMAERFLLSDRSFRESWEVHRWGMLGTPEATARFPAGLILEILGRHGVDVAEMVDDLYQHAAGKHFAYYDHPRITQVDTDSLGVLLRLFKYSSRTKEHHRILGDYLALLDKHVGVDGRLPVWLVDTNDPPAMLLGEECGAIEANLLIGLIDYSGVDHRHMVTAATNRLLGEFVVRGLSVTVNYPPSYTAAILADLLDVLAERDLSNGIAQYEEARRRLTAELERLTNRVALEPQEAACLLWACSRPALANLAGDDWRALILRSQSFDGGWPAEPFFFAPSPGGGIGWYSSRLLTTAICYHGLRLSIKPAAD